jgi:hypothetical protein
VGIACTVGLGGPPAGGGAAAAAAKERTAVADIICLLVIVRFKRLPVAHGGQVYFARAQNNPTKQEG